MLHHNDRSSDNRVERQQADESGAHSMGNGSKEPRVAARKFCSPQLVASGGGVEPGYGFARPEADRVSRAPE